jgi:CubicO group peptidase (beta-lactamase class C family)
VGPLNIPIPNLRSDNVGGAGAISASVRDLLQWSKTNLARGLSPGGQRIFSEASAGELHAPQMPIRKGESSPFEVPGSSEHSYGLGWFLEKFHGAPLISHSGNLLGFSSLAGFLPEQDFAFAVLVNQSGSPAPSSIGRGLCEKVLGITPPGNWNQFYAEAMAEMGRKAMRKYHDALKAPAVKPDIRGCAGVYENPAYGRVFVEPGLGGLVLRFPNKKLKIRIRPGADGEMVIASKLMGAAAFPCRFCREDGVVNAAAFEARLEEEVPSYSRFVRVADR